MNLTNREARALYPLLQNLSIAGCLDYPAVVSGVSKLRAVYERGIGCGGCGLMFGSVEECTEHMKGCGEKK